MRRYEEGVRRYEGGVRRYEEGVRKGHYLILRRGKEGARRGCGGFSENANSKKLFWKINYLLKNYVKVWIK